MGQIFPMNYRLWRYAGLPGGEAIPDISRTAAATAARPVPQNRTQSPIVMDGERRVLESRLWGGSHLPLSGPPRKLLAAYDGTAPSRSALGDAFALAQAYDAEVAVARIASADADTASLAEAVRKDAAGLGRLKREPRVIVSVDSDIVLGLQRLARSEDASWLVIGTRDRSLKDEIKLGSVTEALLKEAVRPVWIARGTSPLDRARILVPVDDSPQAHVSVAQGLQLASTFGGELCLLHVTTAQDAHFAFHDLLKAVPFEQTYFDEVPAHDSIADSILQCARDIDATVVVLGTHREDMHQKLLPSGIAPEIVRRSACRLLVLHPFGDS